MSADRDEPLAAGLRSAARNGDSRTLEEAQTAAREHGGPACRVELARIAIREGRGLEDAAADCEAVLRSRATSLALRARADHVLGQALGKLRRPNEALDALVRARDGWRALADERETAEVEDSQGSVYFSIGRFDLALASYASSLISKALRDDRAGLAITLGNLGRLHLRAGRLDDARVCLERGLELCRSLNDERGRARGLEDLGRVHLARHSLDEADEALRASLTLATALSLHSLAAYAHKDLALVHIERGDLGAARHELELARGLAKESYAHKLLDDALARIALVEGDPDALDAIEAAAQHFAELDVPDDELPARERAMRAACARNEPSRALRHLERALSIARRDGYARWLPSIRELALELDLASGPVEERGRLFASAPLETSVAGYALLEQMLPAGGFGVVYRAYDHERRRFVALKRLHLERLFDVTRRAAVAASMRVELDATRRIDHPLVARVHAIGKDDEGTTYVVQDFVAGTNLRRAIESKSTPRRQAIEVLARIADALSALHEAGVVHRDLKPENVILRLRDGLPVLVDFGIAHVDGHTLDGPMFAGTYGYMAPERRAGERGSAASDVWALGVIAGEWLLGFDPKDGDSTAVVVIHGAGAGSSHATSAQNADPLEHLVARLIDLDPTRRPSAHEAALAFDDLLAI